MKSHRNFTQSTHPIHPHITLNACIGAFCSVWVHFGWFHYCMKLGAKRAQLEQLMQKVVPRSRIRIFGSEPTQSLHWTLNSCFGAFCSVWVHFGLFRYGTKLDAKWATLVELMHKFVAWSRIRIFGNERTRSNQLDPKLKYWCAS
jgi:hypothetical protein